MQENSSEKVFITALRFVPGTSEYLRHQVNLRGKKQNQHNQSFVKTKLDTQPHMCAGAHLLVLRDHWRSCRKIPTKCAIPKEKIRIQGNKNTCLFCKSPTREATLPTSLPLPTGSFPVTTSLCQRLQRCPRDQHCYFKKRNVKPYLSLHSCFIN